MSNSKIFCSFPLSPLFFFKNIFFQLCLRLVWTLPLQFLFITLPSFFSLSQTALIKTLQQLSQLPAFSLILLGNSLSQLPACSSFTPHTPIFRQRDLMYSFSRVKNVNTPYPSSYKNHSNRP